MDLVKELPGELALFAVEMRAVQIEVEVAGETAPVDVSDAASVAAIGYAMALVQKRTQVLVVVDSLHLVRHQTIGGGLHKVTDDLAVVGEGDVRHDLADDDGLLGLVQLHLLVSYQNGGCSPG